MTTSVKEKIAEANNEALHRIQEADPVLVDVAPAGEVIPGPRDKMILHAGPPIQWRDMAGAQKGAMIGEAIFEGWAENKEEAVELLESGEVAFEPCHHHHAVGSMAGTIFKSLCVFVVENRTFGNKAFSRQVADSQQFGAFDKDALKDLSLFGEIWGPTLREGRAHPMIDAAIRRRRIIEEADDPTVAVLLWTSSLETTCQTILRAT